MRILSYFHNLSILGSVTFVVTPVVFLVVYRLLLSIFPRTLPGIITPKRLDGGPWPSVYLLLIKLDAS